MRGLRATALPRRTASRPGRARRTHRARGAKVARAPARSPLRPAGLRALLSDQKALTKSQLEQLLKANACHIAVSARPRATPGRSACAGTAAYASRPDAQHNEAVRRKPELAVHRWPALRNPGSGSAGRASYMRTPRKQELTHYAGHSPAQYLNSNKSHTLRTNQKFPQKVHGLQSLLRENTLKS